MYTLISENLNGLGSKMGTESTSITYIQAFTTIEKAKLYAEREYGKSLKWIKENEGLRTEDLIYVIYHISLLEVDPKN